MPLHPALVWKAQCRFSSTGFAVLALLLQAVLLYSHIRLLVLDIFFCYSMLCSLHYAGNTFLRIAISWYAHCCGSFAAHLCNVPILGLDGLSAPRGASVLQAPKVHVLWGLAKDLSFSRQAAQNQCLHMLFFSGSASYISEFQAMCSGAVEIDCILCILHVVKFWHQQYMLIVLTKVAVMRSFGVLSRTTSVIMCNCLLISKKWAVSHQFQALILKKVLSWHLRVSPPFRKTFDFDFKFIITCRYSKRWFQRPFKCARQ